MPHVTPEYLQALLDAQRAAAAGGPGDANVPVVREQITLTKFGGTTPGACRQEDVIETINIIVEDGVVVAQQTTPGPAFDREEM